MKGAGVWVTGIGAVSTAGLGAPALGRLLLSGETGVRFQAELGFTAAAAETPTRNPATRHLDRSARLFLHAADEAWNDAGLPAVAPAGVRCAVLEGSSLGPLTDLLDEHTAHLTQPGRRRAHPARLLRYMNGSGGAAFAQLHQLGGAVYHLSAGSVSGGCAISEGVAKILCGQVDVVVAGGTECPLHPEILSSFEAAGILGGQKPGQAPCRPFDIARDGTVLGEGAGVLILEDPAHARRRGARPRAIVTGSGMSSESYSMTAPDPSGAGVASATRAALEGLAPWDLGWIKTHGTGTRLNDAAECAGLAGVFGDLLPGLPLTSIKPALGHTLGASPALEAVGTVLALEQGVIPPTLGYAEVDPALPPHQVARFTRPARRNTALLLAESFGGRCVALLLSRSVLTPP